jgi:hypothetical protein
MKCSKCKKTALSDVEYAGKNYCETHFMELMEKRVRKNLRVREIIDVKKEYFLIDDGSSEARLTEYFLNKIFKGYLKIKIVKKQTKQSAKNVEQIFSTNLDEQAALFLDSFLKNKKQKEEKKVMPLEVLMQKEIELLCKILKIKFIPRIKKDILEDLEKRHPGTKFSLFQSKMNLEK